MDDCVYLHWAGDGSQALSQRIDLRSHLGAVLESHFTTRYWKRYHSKDTYLSFQMSITMFMTLSMISFSAFDHLLHQLPDLILDTPDAPEILGNFLARSIADDCIPPKFLHRWIIRAFFRVKNRPNLNSCQKQFPSSNSCMTWTFLRQSNPRALWKSL